MADRASRGRATRRPSPPVARSRTPRSSASCSRPCWSSSGWASSARPTPPRPGQRCGIDPQDTRRPWGPDQVGPAHGPVTALVDGVAVGGDPRDIPLTAHAVVQLDVGTVVAFQPYTFPPGL